MTFELKKHGVNFFPTLCNCIAEKKEKTEGNCDGRINGFVKKESLFASNGIMYYSKNYF